MRWHKSFQEQMQECKKTGNSFIIEQPPFCGYKIIVCAHFKNYCHSTLCFEKRKKEGKKCYAN